MVPGAILKHINGKYLEEFGRGKWSEWCWELGGVYTHRCPLIIWLWQRVRVDTICIELKVGSCGLGKLEWVSMPSSRTSSQPRDQTCVSCGSCIAGRFLAIWATWVHIDNYLKCKWIQCTNQKTETDWVDENMCMYALPLTTSLCFTPPHPNCMYLYCWVNHAPIMDWHFNYLLLFVWLLIVKTGKHLLLLWLCNYYSLNTILLWLVNRNLIELCITKTKI